MQLYLKDDHSSHRAIVLCTSFEEERTGAPKRALIFRCLEDNVAKVMVEFLPKDEVDLSTAVRLTTRRVKGCLGLINIGEDTFLAVILSATDVGNLRPSSDPPEIVAKIHDVGFFSLNSSSWDEQSANTYSSTSGSDQLGENAAQDAYSYTTPQANVFEHPCAPLMKILSLGTFYYAPSPQWDISSRLLRRVSKGKHIGVDSFSYDERFVWNEYIVRSLLDFRDNLDPRERVELDMCQFIVLAIQGYVGIFTIPLPAPPTNGMPTISTICLISRLGWKRAGTRFNTRGIDDDGNCANFVETETIFNTEENCFSYVQVRGSVPLFWEQQGLQTFGHKIQITRPHASQPAFEAHFANLIEEYSAVHAINLLGTKENEAILANSYAQHLHAARAVFGNDIGMTHFDFHAAVRIGGHENVMSTVMRLEGVKVNSDKFGYTLYDTSLQEVVFEQTGIFRTNCLDCLDRTNFVQDILSRSSLEHHLIESRREWLNSSILWTNHRELWAENGDALSRIYAGTGALNTSFTRSGKRTLGGLLSDATKSVSRAYINNFQDKNKQTAIDMFLGNLSFQQPVTIFDLIHDTVNSALAQRISEYSTTKNSTVFVGTWNLNGKPPSESLLPWLFPRSNHDEPDMLVLGFQEIVPLTAQQIVQTDPEKRRLWEKALTGTLDARPGKRAEYILIRSEQLVGTALFVFVKSILLGSIRNVEAATRKTGLRGMSGNKGAVAIRLDFHDTSFCFLTAHLAAGHSNVEERNADYRTIVSGLRFLKGKTIDSHENVIWLADTNYRIDMENDVVRTLAEADDLDALVAADQLRKIMDAGLAFVGYEEGPLLFRPTYRYDIGTDRYDTSEKMRIPAWTDRILYRGSHLDLIAYSRAELVGSDHRPVFAIFRAEIRVIDAAKRNSLHRLLLDGVTSRGSDEKLDEKLASMALMDDAIDYPPPSSEENAWWIDAEHPDGVYATEEVLAKFRDTPANPFEISTDTPLSSPSSSDEELYTDALQLTAPTIVPASRKPPPPPPPIRNVKPPTSDT